jgi:ABC-type branched-subunit amino acid transport system substrate-binding protein
VRLVDQRALVALVIVLVAGGILLMRSPRRESPEAETYTEVEEGGAAPPVRIGVMSTTQESDPKYRLLARLAEDEINAYCNESGVDHRFQFVFKCAGGHAANSRELTEQYHHEGIDLVIGYGWSSFLCSGTRPYAEESGMVLMSPSSTSPIYATEDNVFRLCPHDGMVIRPLVRMILSRGVSEVVILQRGDAWGDMLAEGFQEVYEGMGGRVVNTIRYKGETTGTEFLYHVEEVDDALREAVERVGAGHSGVLLLGFSESTDILQAGGGYPILMNVTWFTTGDTSRSNRIRTEAGEEAARVRLIGPNPALEDTDVYRRVNEAYSALFNESLGFYEANIYDCCWVMALSVIEAGSTDGSAVMDVLLEVAANYTGASGNCHLDSNGDRDAVDYSLWGVFEVGGGYESLVCGTYCHDSDDVEWDEDLLKPTGYETG